MASQTLRFVGGFPTVGAPDLIAADGVLYYEVEVVASLSEPQMGFATSAFEVDVDKQVGDRAERFQHLSQGLRAHGRWDAAKEELPVV